MPRRDKSSDAALIYQHAAADRDADVAARMAATAGTPPTLRARGRQAEIINLPACPAAVP